MRQDWGAPGAAQDETPAGETAASGTAANATLAEASLRNLNWLSFLIADMETAFGPFVPVALTQAGWSQSWIGFALGAGGLAALAAQVPAGLLIDATHHKRWLAGVAVTLLGVASLVIAWLPLHGPVVAALLLQGLTGVVLGPLIAALTLSLSHRGALGERLGRNVRWRALGAGGAAVLLGVVGNRLGPRAVFVAAAMLTVPALLAVTGLHEKALEQAPLRTDHPAALSPRVRPPLRPPEHLVRDRRVWAFFLCVLLFFAGNGGILTVAAGRFASMNAHTAELLVPASIVLPQALVAMLSPRVGRLAQTWGRRPVLLLGFAMVPLRATLFALGGPPALLVAYQALDGVGGAVFGVMLPLVVADLTRQNGRFNLVYAGLGLAGTAGTALSNLMGDSLVGSAGAPVAFLALACAGVLAMCAVAFAMPETRAADYATAAA